MSVPSGVDLLTILITLLADQEGVKISYELEDKEDVSRVQTITV